MLRTKSQPLADTDENAAADEATEVVVRSEGLHEGGSDGEDASNSHSYPSAKVIRLIKCYSKVSLKVECIGAYSGTTEEPTSNNCTDRVGRIYQPDEVRVPFL